jgi:DNA-binding LacI/PurR family transcriptional regulator
MVSSSDLMPGILIAIGAAHLRVPDDVALVCVGDLSWTPALVSPITSLVEPAEEMGANACRLLLERLKEPTAPGPKVLRHSAQLAVRLSCGAPPGLRDVPLQSPESLLFYDAALAWSNNHERSTRETG